MAGGLKYLGASADDEDLITKKILEDTIAGEGFITKLEDDSAPKTGGPLDCNSKPVLFDMYTIIGTEINVANGQHQELTLSSSNLTVTVPAPADSKTTAFHLYINQGSIVRTITWPSTSTVKWANGEAPDLSTASGIYGLYFTWKGSYWLGGWARYY